MGKEPEAFLHSGDRLIRLSKPRLAPEDEVALRFAQVIENLGISYVVVAGYVAILFGRGRRSDDVDFILEEISEDAFVELCRLAGKEGFSLMQGDVASVESLRRMYRDYLREGYGLRFMYKDIVIPNVEVKMASTAFHRHALTNHIKVVLNERYTLRVSPLELQIAYKLYLGSDKDVSDAVFMYTLFKEHLNPGELNRWCRELAVDCSILGGI